MVSRLVLVRHAKTQRQDEGLSDRDRQLTMAGRRGIEARYPATLQLLASTEDVKLWSSPAQRAIQTAEVVARVLGIGGIEIRESLYEDGVDALLPELADEEGTVIVVGHNPFMEQLYERFAGVPQAIRPGAIASFVSEGPTGDIPGACMRLEWFVQGPEASSWQTLVDLEHVLAEAGERIRQRAQELLDNPDDPESLHQYRISIRVARSLLSFLRPYCRRGRIKGLMRELKALQDPTSRIRELDMLLAELDPGTPEAGMVRADCSEEREAFVERLAKRKVQRALESATEQLGNVSWSRAVCQDGLEARLLFERVNEMRSAYERAMAEVDYEDREAVHDVRKQAKALRYVTRECASILPDNAGSTNVRAKAVQDKLGELCDCWNDARLLVEICGAEAVDAASRFVVRANEIVSDLKTGREHGLAISDS